MRACYVMLFVLFLAPLVQAQSAAPHPSPVDFRLYANGDGDDEYTGWMNTLLDEPANDDTAMGSTESCLGVPLQQVDPDMDRTYTYTLSPALTGDVYLDGMVQFVLYVGASSAENTVDLEVVLENGATTVASGQKTEHSFTPAGSGPYKLITWEVEPEVAIIDSSQPLVWKIFMTDDSCNNDGAFVGVAADRGRSHVELPIIDTDAPYTLPGPELAFVNVTTPELIIDANWTSQSDHTQYNWTAPAGPQRLSMQGAVDNGSVDLTILDSANATLYNATLTGPVNITQQLDGAAGMGSNATAGWRMFVNATDATGNLAIEIAPESAVFGEHDLDGIPGHDKGGNTTAGDQGSPGLGILLLPAVGAAAWLRRRT